jgi:hypothetical protein
MQDYVSQLLADTGSTKWTDVNAVLPALKSAQEEFVIKILGFASRNRKVFEVLSEIQASTSQSVGTSGYALSGLDSSPGPFLRNGLITASATLDSVTRWCQIMDVADLHKQRNRWFKGNDERPICYVYGEKFYLIASTGSYPVTTTIYYIREPKELVASGASGYQVTTCELNAAYHRLISEMAAANCHRMLADESSIAKYDRMMARIEPRIAAIAMSGITGEKVSTKEIK